MGNRKWNELSKRGIKCTHCWPSPGIGKWWKRRLNKARRKYAKNECEGIRGKDPAYLESWVNYKSW